MSVELLCIDPAKVDLVWPFVSPLIGNAVDRCGDWTLEDVRRVLDQGALLWVTSEDGKTISAAAVTRLIETRKGLCCNVVACGGKDDDWRERFAPIEQYAKDEGCTITRIEGRKGWGRIFPDYKLSWITLEKAL